MDSLYGHHPAKINFLFCLVRSNVLFGATPFKVAGHDIRPRAGDGGERPHGRFTANPWFAEEEMGSRKWVSRAE